MTGGFIADGEQPVSVELPGGVWYYVREALLIQTRELTVLARIVKAGASIPDAPDYAVWARALDTACAAIFEACKGAPGSILDPTQVPDEAPYNILRSVTVLECGDRDPMGFCGPCVEVGPPHEIHRDAEGNSWSYPFGRPE